MVVLFAGVTLPVSVDIENGEMYSDWYRNALYQGYTFIRKGYRKHGGFGFDNRIMINIHQRVFRAKGTTDKLVISDWQNSTTPGGPIGLIHSR